MIKTIFAEDFFCGKGERNEEVYCKSDSCYLRKERWFFCFVGFIELVGGEDSPLQTSPTCGGEKKPYASIVVRYIKPWNIFVAFFV